MRELDVSAEPVADTDVDKPFTETDVDKPFTDSDKSLTDVDKPFTDGVDNVGNADNAHPDSDARSDTNSSARFVHERHVVAIAHGYVVNANQHADNLIGVGQYERQRPERRLHAGHDYGFGHGELGRFPACLLSPGRVHIAD